MARRVLELSGMRRNFSTPPSMNQLPEIIEYRLPSKKKDLQSHWVDSLGGPC
jgi:hypothetical protein